MSKMSLEERALRHADGFFDIEDKWYPGNKRAPTCVGLELLHYHDKHGSGRRPCTNAFQWASKVMDVPSVIR